MLPECGPVGGANVRTRALPSGLLAALHSRRLSGSRIALRSHRAALSALFSRCRRLFSGSCRLGRPQAADGVLDLAAGQLPAFPVNVEDDAVGVFELPLEAVVLGLAEIEEEFAAGLFDLPLLFWQVVALEAEMVDADPTLRHAGADLAFVLQQCEIDLAVAHVAVPRGRAFADRRALEPEGLLVEIGGGLDVLDAQCDVADTGCHVESSLGLTF